MNDKIRPKPDEGRGGERSKSQTVEGWGRWVEKRSLDVQKGGGWGGAANASLCTAGWIDGV